MEPQRFIMEKHMIFATFAWVLRPPQIAFEAASNGASSLYIRKTNDICNLRMGFEAASNGF